MNAITLALQVLLVAAAGWLALRLGVRDARHRAWGALLVLGAVVCVPLLPVLPEQNAVAAPQAEATPLPLPQWRLTLSPAPTQPLPVDLVLSEAKPLWQWPHWTTIVLVVWATGAALLGLRHLGRTLRVARLKLQPHSRSGVAMAAVASPCLVGIFKPVVVVPEACASWTDEQWRWTMAHEREHLCGRDTLVVWLLGWLRAALWWNPFVHALIEMWEQAREEICDHAASRPDEAAAYSEFLLIVAAVPRMPGMAMAVSRPARRLRARLLALLEGRPVRRSPHWLFVVLAVAVLAAGGALVSCVGVETASPKVDGEKKINGVFPVSPQFLSAAVSGTGDRPTAKVVLERAGIDFPPGTSAVFNPTTSQLIVRHTERRMTQIKTVLEALAARQDPADKQVYLSIKWLECPEETPLPADLQVLTDPQFQVVMRMLSKQKGVDLLSAPSVTCKFGLQVVSEVVRELVKPEAPIDWVGTRIEVTPLFHQDKHILSLHPELRLPMKNGQRVKGSFDPDESITVQYLSRRESVAIEDGQTVALYIGSPEPGRKVVLFVTAALISPIGEPFSREEVKRQQKRASEVPKGPGQATATPAQEGRVRLRTHLLLRHAGSDDVREKVLPGWKPAAAVPSNPLTPQPLPAEAQPAPFAVAGIMTDKQFQTVLKSMQTHKTVTIETLPEEIVATGKQATLRAASGHELTVNTAVGPDGKTLELMIGIERVPPDLRTQIKTAVTIWNGQTVLLASESDVICVTAEMVE